MSRVVVLFELEGMTSKEYDAILETLGEKERLTDKNRPTHIAFEKDKKWCVVDVWESEEALADFAEKDLLPAFQKLGLNPPRPQVLPVYRYINVASEESISV